jgi:hypothetical protein
MGHRARLGDIFLKRKTSAQEIMMPIETGVGKALFCIS